MNDETTEIEANAEVAGRAEFALLDAMVELYESWIDHSAWLVAHETREDMIRGNEVRDCANELKDNIEKFKRDQCQHEWTPMDNKVITGGHICMKCMTLKPE